MRVGGGEVLSSDVINALARLELSRVEAGCNTGQLRVTLITFRTVRVSLAHSRSSNSYVSLPPPPLEFQLTADHNERPKLHV